MPRLFFGCYAVAAAYAAYMHLFATEPFAGTFSWGYAPGWQREIGFFDLYLLYLCASSMRLVGHSAAPASIALGLAGLSGVLGLNHFLGYLASGLALHAFWTGLNVLAVGGAAWSYWLLRQGSLRACRTIPRREDSVS